MKKDLVILVADKNIEWALKGIFSRPQALSIRSIEPDICVHPHRDPGCFTKGHFFLNTFLHSHNHALILFDRHGCGQEQWPREELEQEVEIRLQQAGWKEYHASVIVLDPELEIWVWSDSPHVATILSWDEQATHLKGWLIQKNFWQVDQIKPYRPKEALEQILRKVCKPRSSALYEELAKKVSLKHCTDNAFIKLKTTLQKWFAVE